MASIAYGTITITDTYDGTGLLESIPYYLASPLSSGITRETSGWSREVPALTSINKYLWVYYVNRYGEGASEPEMIEVYGNVASFDYDGEVAPLEKCVVTIEPKRAGSGDPSPTNIRPISGWTGAQVWNDPKYGGTVVWNQLADNSNAPSSRRGLTITGGEDGFTVDGTATASVGAEGWFALDKNNAKYSAMNGHKVLVSFSIVSGTVTSSTSNQNPVYFLLGGNAGSILIGTPKIVALTLTSNSRSTFHVDNGTIISNAKFRIQCFDLTTMFGAETADYIYSLEQTNVGAGVAWFKELFPKDYYPYNSGESTCVSAVNGDLYSEYSVTWEEAGTVYGGTLDVVRGKLTVTHEIKTITTTANASVNYSRCTVGSLYYGIAGEGIYCNALLVFYGQASRLPSNNIIVFSSTAYNEYVAYIRFADADSATTQTQRTTLTNQILAQMEADGHPLQIVFKLTNPVEYDIMPEEITTLLGKNNIWADTGNIDVGYYDHQTVTTPYVIGVYGDPGQSGLNTATITLYKRAATTPTAPSGTLRYTFENGELTGSLSGWSQSIPATSTEPVWAIGATAISSNAYDDIASEEWTDPAKIAENGTPGSAGYNQATIFLYQRAASKPNKPSTNTTYTFTTGALSSLPTGWQRAIPTANGNPCYVTTAAAISTGSSVVIKANDWSDVTMLAEDGFSPIAKVTKSGNTATISITDAKGTTTQTVKDGISITSVTNYYLASASASGVTPSTSGWTTDPTASAAQMTATKQYLWNYEVTAGSDGNTISTTSPAIIGRYGQNGGAGRGISSITEHYLATSADSGITTSTTGWTTTVQTTTTTNKYLWNYETITYTDSTSNNTTPRIIGTYGDAGEQGFSLRGALIRDRWTDNTWNTTYGEIGNTSAFSNYDIFSSTTGTNGKLPISTWAVGDLFNITGTATDTGIAYTGTWKYTTKRTSDTQTIPCELIALTRANSGSDAQWYYGTDLTHTSGTATLPTGSTAGVVVGAMYLNTKTSLCYKCTAISGTTATWTYAGNIADGVIDNISIGGRNLFRGTATASVTNYVFYPEAQGSTLNDGIIRLIPNSSSGAYAKYIVDYLDYDKYKDEYYTLSVDVRLADIESEYTETSVNLYMGVSIASRINQTFAKTKDKYLIGNEVNYTDITSNWRRISLTCKVPDDLTTGVNSALVAGSMITGEFGAYLPNTRPVEFRRPKLERGNKATDWIPAPEDVQNLISIVENKANTAQTTANNALTSANGKNKVYHQATKPSGGTYVKGDTWFDSDDGYKMYTWNGSSWIAEQLGENALADLSITNAKIANGTIDNAKIATLDAGKITTGTLDAQRIAANSLTLGMLSSSVQTSLINPVEYIIGTQTSGTRYWTGVTRESSLTAGKMIAYKLPYAGTSSAAYLELTLTTGQATSTTTGRIGVYRNNSIVTNQFAAGSVINMTYDGTYWRVTGMGSDTTTNYYDRQNYKASLYASEAIAATKIAVLGTDGKLKTLANSSFDMTGPILYVATAYSATDVSTPTARTTNYSFWGTAFDLSDTHAIEGAAAGKPVYIVGTVSGTIFTPNETVLTCVIPEQENDLYYIKLGLMSTATTAVLESQHPLYAYYNGAFQRVDYGAQTKATEVNRTAENALNNAQDAQDAAENALAAASANTNRIETNESKINTLENSTGTLSSAIATLHEIIGSSDDEGLRKRQKDADELLTLLQAEIGAFNSWLEFKASSEDPNEKTGLIIGKTGQSGVYVVQLQGDAISFYENRDAARINDTQRRVAFFQNHYLYVDNVKAGKNMEVGNFRWITQSNGNMSLVYIGGSE